MVIVGGEANSDLRDIWALDLDEMIWYNPEVLGIDNYTPKRFHTVSTITDSQIVTFGGCHSEYVHMNELHVFELSKFFENPKNNENMVTCTKVPVSETTPSTRWGHAAAAANGKLYILGGRNEQDIIDLHEFDLEKSKWKPVDIISPVPKARRRHSCLLVSGALVMFGGFDGSFYNDLNILDLTRPHKQII
jgi:N-acetylneuraminic acid mutarotase